MFWLFRLLTPRRSHISQNLEKWKDIWRKYYFHTWNVYSEIRQLKSNTFPCDLVAIETATFCTLYFLHLPPNWFKEETPGTSIQHTPVHSELHYCNMDKFSSHCTGVSVHLAYKDRNTSLPPWGPFSRQPGDLRMFSSTVKCSLQPNAPTAQFV